MTRFDVLKRLAAFAACARAFAKTPQGAGIVVVRIGERHSDICLVRGGVEIARERIAIGAADFVNDAGCAGFIRDTLKRAGAGETPVLPAGERRSIRRAGNSVAVGVLLAFLAIAPCVSGQQAKAKPADTTAVKTSRVANNIEMKRRDILNGIQTEESPHSIAERRLLLAEGTEPERVRNDRNRGADFTPDANQMWLTVLRRDVAEGRALELYEKLVNDGHGTEKPEELLNAVGTAALVDRPKAQIGGEVVEATPSLSLDAGYTKGFRDRVTMKSLGIADTPDNVAKLHAIAESCLNGQNTKAPPASTCFTAGLALAAKDNPLASTRR